MFSRAISFGESEPPPARPAPVFGQHADEVLSGHGYSQAEIAQLRQDGVIP